MRIHSVNIQDNVTTNMDISNIRGGWWDKNSPKRSFVLLSIVLIFQIALCIGYGVQKTDLFLDEALTFAFVHSDENDVPEDGKIYEYGDPLYSFMSADDFLDINVRQIYKNTYEDPHPPLYHYLFACIYSLTPGSVSPMPGIVLNTICLALVTILLFLIARRLSLNQIESAAVSALWAWSAGMVGNAVLLRMYALQTFACMLSVYVAVRFFQKNMQLPKYKNSHNLLPERGTRRLLFCVAFTTLFGFFTHYYFVVFSCILYLSVGIIMIYRRRIKQALWLGFSVVIGYGIAIAIYPRAITDILAGSRGAEAMSLAKAISYETFIERTTKYLSILSRDFFINDPKICAVIILATIICVVLLMRKRKILIQSSVSLDPLLFISITVIAYFMIVSNVSVMVVDRYIFAIYPLLGLLIFAPMHLLRIVIKKHGLYRYAPLGLTFIGIILAFSLLTPTVQHLKAYDNPEMNSALDSARENTTSITIWPNFNLYAYELASYYIENEKNVFYYVSTEDPISKVDLPDDEQSMTLCISSGLVDDSLLEKLEIDENVHITKLGSVLAHDLFDVKRLDNVDSN